MERAATVDAAGGQEPETLAELMVLWGNTHAFDDRGDTPAGKYRALRLDHTGPMLTGPTPRRLHRTLQAVTGRHQ